MQAQPRFVNVRPSRVTELARPARSRPSIGLGINANQDASESKSPKPVGLRHARWVGTTSSATSIVACGDRDDVCGGSME